jgi:hypothetical protein
VAVADSELVGVMQWAAFALAAITLAVLLYLATRPARRPPRLAGWSRGAKGQHLAGHDDQEAHLGRITDVAGEGAHD